MVMVRGGVRDSENKYFAEFQKCRFPENESVDLPRARGGVSIADPSCRTEIPSGGAGSDPDRVVAHDRRTSVPKFGRHLRSHRMEPGTNRIEEMRHGCVPPSAARAPPVKY